MIDPVAAVAEAKRGLEGIHLGSNPTAAAAGAMTGPGEPLLVTRLDQPHSDYYLVPWKDERGIVMVVQVNAWSGKMASVATFPTPQPRLVMSPDEARLAVSQRLATTIAGEPLLVWRPCREAASPLLPLYQLATAMGNAFVAVDGSVFRSLTPFGNGG